MKVKLEDIPEEGLMVSLGDNAGAFESVLRELTEGDELPPISGSVTLLPITGSDSLWVSGDVKTRLTMTCSRCLEPVSVEVADALQLTLEVQKVPDAGEVEEDIELDAEALDVSFYDPSEGVLLGDVVREQIILASPSVVLCQADCKGICQRCGADLNREPCRCDGPPVDPRFAVLAALKKPQ